MTWTLLDLDAAVPPASAQELFLLRGQSQSHHGDTVLSDLLPLARAMAGPEMEGARALATAAGGLAEGGCTRAWDYSLVTM